MTNEKKNPISNQQRFDTLLEASATVSATEATGSVPAAPQSQSQLDAYKNLIDTVASPDKEPSLTQS